MGISENTGGESPPSSLPPTPPTYHNNKNTEIQNSNSRITTNTSNGQSSSFIAPDTYEELYNKHKLEKSQEPDNDELPCDDSLDKKRDEPIAITLATFDATAKTTANPFTEQESQLQRGSSSSNKRKRSISQSDSSHQTEQRLTTHENSTNDNTNITVSLLNPLASRVDMRTDRDTELKDCLDNKPVLIVRGSLPENVEMEMAMISTVSKKHYYSLYQFHDFNSGTNTFTNKLSRKVILEKYGDNIYIIKLGPLFVRKEPAYDRKSKNENDKRYKLTSYPSGKEELVKGKGPTIFANRYNLNKPRLAIQFFSNNSTEPIKINGIENKSILFSDLIDEVRNLSRESKVKFAELKIENIAPGGNFILFDANNQYTMEFLIELPEEFRDKLDSYCKGLEISLFNEKFSSIYHISTHDGYKNSMSVEIKWTSFKIQVIVVKKTLTELEQNSDFLQALRELKQQIIDEELATYISSGDDLNSIIAALGLNSFRVQFRLIHVLTTIDSKELIDFFDGSIWQSSKFTESFEHSSNVDIRDRLDAPQQNPIGIDLNAECDYSRGQDNIQSTLICHYFLSYRLPVTKTTENNHHE